MKRLRILIPMMRLPTLLAGFSPVIIGNALGLQDLAGPVTATNIVMVFVTVLTVALLQSAANLINDVKDAASGVDQAERLGPKRLAHTQALPISYVRRAYQVLLGAALVLALVVTWRGGWPVIVIALACIAAAYAYSGGPFPLAYHGLGEAAALLFFGPVAVSGCYYLQTLHFSPTVMAWSLAPGFLAAALMATNNFRDRFSDVSAGKKTLATVLPAQYARFLAAAFIVLGIAWLCSFGVVVGQSVAAVIMGVILVHYMRRRLWPLWQQDGVTLNIALKRTAQLNFLFAIFWGVLVAL